MHGKVILIQLQGGRQVSFTKVDGQLQFQENDMGFDADAAQSELSEDSVSYYESCVACGQDPAVAHFSTMLHDFIEAHEYNDEAEDPYEDLYVNNPETMGSWERIVYELWITPSRLRNGDRFELDEDQIRCVNLNTAFTYTDSANGVVEALLPNRTAN